MAFRNDMLMIIAEAVTCKIFFETFAGKRKDKPAYMSYIILFLLTLVMYGLSSWLADYLIIKEFLLIITAALLMFVYLEISFVQSFVLSFLHQMMVLTVDYGGTAFILHYLIDRESLIRPYLALISIFCKLCVFFIVLVVNRSFQNRSVTSLKDMDTIKFALFPLFSLIMLAAVITAYQYVERPEQADILTIIAAGLLGMNVLVYYLLCNLLKRERKIRNEKLYMLEVRSQIHMYQALSESFDRQKKKVHEFKNQILCIEGLLQQKKFEKAGEYVKGISGSFVREMDLVNTNHAIINAIINTKYKEAEEKQIVFVIKVNDLGRIWMEDADIVVILSNLLDNAIEATEKCEKNRIIKLKFVIEGDIIISVKNTYAQKPQMLNGNFVTSKAEKEGHGIGIQNIVDTVKKYNGSYVVQDKSNELLFSIIIPRVLLDERKGI